MLAAVEAYSLGDGRKRKELETTGLLWGTTREPCESTDGRRFIYVEKVAQSLSASRASGHVSFHDQAPSLMNMLVSRLSPQVHLLGHFHTHPYKNIKQVREIKGYEASRGDVNFMCSEIEETNLYWDQSGNSPVMLIMTICKLGRVHEKIRGQHLTWNCFEFDVGEFRFWLAATVGYLDKLGCRCLTSPETANRNPGVFLDMDSKFFNYKGSRILRSQ
jgi:hypothetical protein